MPSEVTSALDGAEVVLSRASHDALMQRLQEVRETHEIRLSFTAVDGSRPPGHKTPPGAGPQLNRREPPRNKPDDQRARPKTQLTQPPHTH